MPHSYEVIKNKCISKGGSKNSCQAKAARIYNGVIRKNNPSLPKLSNKKGAK